MHRRAIARRTDDSDQDSDVVIDTVRYRFRAAEDSEPPEDTGDPVDTDVTSAAVCGDSIPAAGLDDATVYSSTMAEGVCRPDCQGFVVEKFIGVTSQRVAPGQGGVSGVDVLCRTDFGTSAKGLVVDGTNRIATVSAYAGDGQVDWVLLPYTRYVSAETGLLVFITDDTRLLGGVGGSGADLYNPIRAADDGWGVWTGANADWTSGVDCDDWTDSSDNEGPSTNATATFSGAFPNNAATGLCGFMRRFACVEL